MTSLRMLYNKEIHYFRAFYYRPCFRKWIRRSYPAIFSRGDGSSEAKLNFTVHIVHSLNDSQQNASAKLKWDCVPKSKSKYKSTLLPLVRLIDNLNMPYMLLGYSLWHCDRIPGDSVCSTAIDYLTMELWLQCSIIGSRQLHLSFLLNDIYYLPVSSVSFGGTSSREPIGNSIVLSSPKLRSQYDQATSHRSTSSDTSEWLVHAWLSYGNPRVVFRNRVSWGM